MASLWVLGLSTQEACDFLANRMSRSMAGRLAESAQSGGERVK